MDSLTDNRISRLDRITLIALIAVFFLCSYFSLTDGCYWGDDYAGYISEGIAIAEGKLDVQSVLNAKMHPSPLPEEAVGNPLVYVWGYPLILALVYSLTGFDRVTFSSVFFYKLPSVIAFALLSAVLFLFLRRRFRYALSLLLTFAFCSCAEFYSFFNTLYSDMYFLLFALLSLYLTELFLAEHEHPKHEILGVVAGVLLGCMYEIRLNGAAILLSCILAHGISMVREKKFSRWETILPELIPYIIFFVLKTISEALLAPPTPNASDFRGFSFPVFLSNLATYFGLIRDFFSQIWNSLFVSPLYSVLRRFSDVRFSDLRALSLVLTWISILLSVMGMAVSGIKKNLHLTLLVLFYILAASMLPYTQGMRYLYPVLPVILLFFGYGIRFLSGKVFMKKSRAAEKIACVIVAGMCVLCLYQLVSNDWKHVYAIPEKAEIVNVEDIYMQNAYSPCAVEVYNHIRSDTPEDATFAFFAPRGLYLNTERFTIKPDVNGHSIEEADFYLDYRNTGEYNITPPLGDDFEIIFSNDEFDLYKRINFKEK